MEQTKNIFETQSIGKLIKKFSIPCVISMVVAALYNIVDQIFIGWSEAGEFGNAATNIVYPFTVFALGIALMIGDGTSANFSIFLGEKNKEKTSKCIGNGILFLLVFSAVILIVGILLKDNILLLFGASKDEELCYSYANDYYTVICYGAPFYIIGQGLNGTIRADGSPKYAMACTLAGAVANIILDPIFIFVFNTSVKGAAIATVIGEVITFLMSVLYLLKSKNFRLKGKDFSVDFHLLGKIVSLGLASLIIQFSIVAIMTVNNNLFSKYGYETLASTGKAFGAITPLAVIGIVMKVFGIVISIVVGISLGGQPIIGYNIGAKNIDKVKQCISKIIKLILMVGAIAFILFEVFPDLIITIFGNNNSEEYMEYARLTIRIFLSGILFTCFIKSTSIILQAIGNSIKSTLVAIGRDVIIFIPATIIIASITHNIISMLWAALIADVIAAIFAFIMLYLEIKKLEKKNR